MRRAHTIHSEYAMNKDFAILLVLFGISATANIGFALTWLQTRKRLRAQEGRTVDLTQLDDLVARVESSVDAVNARVEDLISGQDFMNRVLTDRLERLGRALPAREPRDTPV